MGEEKRPGEEHWRATPDAGGVKTFHTGATIRRATTQFIPRAKEYWASHAV